MEMNKEESRFHEDTELRLGLPGCSHKRKAVDVGDESTSGVENDFHQSSPPKKVQAIGWPPIRSYRKNHLQATRSILVKVSMDGAPYLRKIDLKLYQDYGELIKALEDLFSFNAGKSAKRETENDGLGYEATYEDKDGDWMLVGDVPWEMFTTSCKRAWMTETAVPGVGQNGREGLRMGDRRDAMLAQGLNGFVTRSRRNALNVKEKLFKHGIVADANCCICSVDKETVCHIFQHYLYIRLVMACICSYMNILIPSSNAIIWIGIRPSRN
ncbi:hypothetical protein KSS87_022281, partial [Heliosperma pusillum]